MADTEPAPPAAVDSSAFLRRLQIATMSMLLIVLAIHLLEKFKDVLQPLFIALFIGFLIYPIHRWLVNRGIRSMFAYGVILFLVGLGLTGLGTLMYENFTEMSKNMNLYEERLEQKIIALAAQLPFQTPKLEEHFLRIVLSPDRMTPALGVALGRGLDVSTGAMLTFVYLLFLVAEKVSFPRRVQQAFGAQEVERIRVVMDKINQAIGRYIAVKTLVSALAGILSYAVLAGFGVDFAVTWGLLIFLFNYIPYLGSLIAVTLPILVAFVQFDELWKGVAIAIALIGVQQIIGFVIEPRMAGQRLDVSPLLIVLSLAFWGVVWGIVGMILAVPLLVITKIIFDHIHETKPIATLISNQ
jgi:predicted PurR-regulated permease PerM